MARDTTDRSGIIPSDIGDLNDVSDVAAPADKATLVWSAADTEFKKVAPSAAIADGAVDTPRFNLVLAALRAHGIIAA